MNELIIPRWSKSPPLMTLTAGALTAVNVGFGVWLWQAASAGWLAHPAITAQWIPPKLQGVAGTSFSKPLESYVQTLQRPVFNRSRAPWQAPILAMKAPDAPLLVPSNIASPVEKLDAALRGIITSSAGSKALIMTKDVPYGLWLHSGEILKGWKLERIDGNSVSFSNGEQVTHIDLYVGTAQTP